MIRSAFTLVLMLIANPVFAVCVAGDGPWIERVCYSAEGNAPRYGHDILGASPEWSELSVFYGASGQAAADGNRGASAITFPNGIIEDVAPRLVDVDGDGRLEAIIVQSSYQQGARLAVIGFAPRPELRAATPYIGRRNRWLAPIGAVDLDGDGLIEIAYVDRPHLAKTLRVWRYQDGALVPVADLPGLTNHRIGEADIGGGIRDCGQGPEMITASADWSRVMATTLQNGQLSTRDIGRHVDRSSFAAALACKTLP